MDWQSILVVAIVGLSLLWMIRRVFLGAIGWVRLGGEHRSACGHCTGCSHADQKLWSKSRRTPSAIKLAALHLAQGRLK